MPPPPLVLILPSYARLYANKVAFAAIGTTTALAPRSDGGTEGANGSVIPPLYLFDAGKEGRKD